MVGLVTIIVEVMVIVKEITVVFEIVDGIDWGIKKPVSIDGELFELFEMLVDRFEDFDGLVRVVEELIVLVDMIKELVKAVEELTEFIGMPDETV